MGEPAPRLDLTEVPAGLEGSSRLEAQRRLVETGRNRWVKRDRLARLRDLIRLIADPMAVMLAVAATMYFLLGETRDAVVLAVALIPVLGVDVVWIKSAHLSDDEGRALLSGAPVTKLLDSDPSKEVAVLGAVWIGASPSSYVRQMMDIERFERGGAFLVTKRIGNPPSADDFASLQLPDEDLDDLRECHAGD